MALWVLYGSSVHQGVGRDDASGPGDPSGPRLVAHAEAVRPHRDRDRPPRVPQIDEAVVSIENPFVLRSGGAVIELDPSDRAALGPVLALYPDTLASGAVTPIGTLTLDFLSGATIEVPSSPSYEAWQVEGPGEYLVVCSPGTSGDLAVWP